MRRWMTALILAVVMVAWGAAAYADEEGGDPPGRGGAHEQGSVHDAHENSAASAHESAQAR